jgi:hypothetical protein
VLAIERSRQEAAAAEKKVTVVTVSVMSDVTLTAVTNNKNSNKIY